jgi:hypothetical protein
MHKKYFFPSSKKFLFKKKVFAIISKCFFHWHFWPDDRIGRIRSKLKQRSCALHIHFWNLSYVLPVKYEANPTCRIESLIFITMACYVTGPSQIWYKCVHVMVCNSNYCSLILLSSESIFENNKCDTATLHGVCDVFPCRCCRIRSYQLGNIILLVTWSSMHCWH